MLLGGWLVCNGGMRSFVVLPRAFVWGNWLYTVFLNRKRKGNEEKKLCSQISLNEEKKMKMIEIEMWFSWFCSKIFPIKSGLKMYISYWGKAKDTEHIFSNKPIYVAKDRQYIFK